MSVKYSGGCLCGAVRYHAEVEPKVSFNCHCRDCQKSSGGAYAPIAFFAQSQLNIQGDVKYYQSLGVSGKMIKRGFCGNCGSNLFGLPEIAAELISIRAGTLDDPNMFRPKFEIFTSHANQWDILNQDIQHFTHAIEKKK
ncbi:aldehyde-activating protein [Acinetobacter defluvii]|uniref:GFA family protein n=1 Tax=Acinetobacter defluvii TaxID=1871111 RepID=UPI00148F71C1|nr:GFA family protein [Acinetobacter defluvii]NNP74379.1 aldehyde-activating protein [Acinetobacter defluvii]